MDPGNDHPAGITRHRLRFTGSGRGYFRLWLVNLLLTLVTLGLYIPFSRRRTLQYCYAHVELGGTRFEYTGDRRWILIGLALYFGISIAGRMSDGIGKAIFTGVVLASPWLWASNTRFRLANTRWRGLRGSFDASTREVYRASWAYAGLSLAILAWVFFAPDPHEHRAASGWPPWAWIVAPAAFYLLWPLQVRLRFEMDRLCFDRSSFGGLPSHWNVRFGELFKLALIEQGFFLLALVLVLGVLIALDGPCLIEAFKTGVMPCSAFPFPAWTALLTIALASAPAMAWSDARTFQRVWSGVHLGELARFRCDLRTRAFVLLRLRNVVLSLLTLGFWWPFASVSEYRMKIESVSLELRGDLDEIVASLDHDGLRARKV